MKPRLHTFAAALVAAALLTGCMSRSNVRLGMTEKEWLQSTLVGDIAYMEGSVKAYKSGGAYYYFVDGKLVKVDAGMLPAQKIILEVQNTAAK